MIHLLLSVLQAEQDGADFPKCKAFTVLDENLRQRLQQWFHVLGWVMDKRIQHGHHRLLVIGVPVESRPTNKHTKQVI